MRQFHPYDDVIVAPSPHRGIVLPRLYGTGQHHRHPSQGAGSKTHYYVRARLDDGAIRWVGIFHDPDAYDVFLLALMRHQIDGDPIARDIAALSEIPWYPGLDELPLVYEFATVVSFTAVGTTSWTPPGLVTKTDYLVVGGGAGGGSVGGGGGGGGFLTSINLAVVGNQSVTVGIAGTGGAGGGAAGGYGGNSAFASVSATGGGAGGGNGGGGGAGGSGGGAGCVSGAAGGAGTSGQGYAGGSAPSGTPYPSGGGGGAGGVGGSGSGSVSGAGGNGAYSAITGTGYYYGAGGGGCETSQGAAPGAGGTTGGGGGGYSGGGTASFYGGGGGAGGNNGGSNGGGYGYQGIVILSFTPGSLVWMRQRHYLRR